MTVKKQIEMANLLLRELESILHDVYGEGYIAKFVTNEFCITMYTEEFLITYDIESGMYSISFLLGLSGDITAKHMVCILSVFEATEIQFLSDSYYDKDTSELAFGRDAIAAKQKDVLQSLGKCKCEMCELVYPIDYVEDNVCVKCKKNFSQFKWH